jgi:thiol:disulfide interchange protein DsbD
MNPAPRHRARAAIVSGAFLLLAVCAIFSAAGSALRGPQDGEDLPSPSTIVKPHAYVSLDPVPREKKFQVAVQAEIARGFHMNSHTPSDPYLIPTTLTPSLPAGIRLAGTIYPDGQLKEFPFSPGKPLSVYAGSVTIRLKLSADASVPLGATTIPMTLRYQACNDASCLPPVNIPVSVPLEVAAAGAKARAVHPEIFSAASAK